MVTLSDSLVSSSSRVMSFYARTDLTAKKEQYLGRTYWIVKDPLGLKYYRFQAEEYFILHQLDGTRSLDNIKENFEKEFPPQKITLDELQNFIGQLHQSSLIVAGVPNQGHELLKRRNKRRRQEILAAMSNILSIRFKGIDPNRILDKMLPFVRWMYHPVSIFCALMLMISALSLLLIEFDTFRSKLPAFHQFFGLKNMFFLSLTLGVTKVIHEFGHGLTCKYFGGECHEMGVMILVLTPCLYCNVSDSWMLPNKWHRAAIGLAGVFVECTLASICTFFWWFSKEGLFHYICLNVMFLSSVSTIIFNINPLLRYDGYYILADILEIPNLRQKATKVMAKKASEWFLGMENPDDPFLPQRNQLLFAAYTIAAVAYRWVVMASIMFFIYRFFDSYGLKVVGQIIGAMSLYGLLVMPLWKIGKFFWVPGRIYRVKKVRFYSSLTGLMLILAFCIFVPLPYSVYAPLVLELRQDSATTANLLVPKTGGELVEINKRDGDVVKKGDILVRLRNRSLDQDLVRLQGELLEAKSQHKMFSTLLNQRDAAARQQELQERIEALTQMVSARLRDRQLLELRAPIDGTVVSPYWRPAKKDDDPTVFDELPEWYGTALLDRNIGLPLQPGTHVASVGDPTKLEALMIVNQSKIDFVQAGQKVKIVLEALPSRIFEGTIERTIDIEHQRMESVPIQLSTKGGGAVPTTSEQNGVEKPQSPSFRVRVDVDNDELMMHVGMTGQGKIHVEPQTLFARLRRLVTDVFNFKL